MDCVDCKSLITAFMDSDLDSERSEFVRMHLAECGDCALVCEEIAMLLDVVSTEGDGILPENQARQIWCRINNVLESEQKPLVPQSQPEPQRRGLWHFSFWQLATGLACIALVSSLITIAALRNYYEPSATDSLASATSHTFLDRMMVKVGLADSPQEQLERKLRDRQAAIDYWNTRVQVRRGQWDSQTRAAFDRNLREIDDSLNEYHTILQRDPEDDLTVEMMDSVLNEKMDLLRDFSDL